MQQKLIKINNKILKVKVANNPISQSIGLMFKKHLKQDEGMIFKFYFEIKLSFWNLFTFIPLDIIWINKDNIIVDITKNTKPYTKPTSLQMYVSRRPYKYVLEVNENSLIKYNVKIGDIITFID